MALAPASRDSAVAWTRTTQPRTSTLIRFRWRYQDEQVKYAGRGSTRIAPPDSLRFDFAGPFNLGNGAAVVIGDSVAWADPEKNFRSLVPAIPMLWAAFAMVRPPAEDATVLGGQAMDSLTHTRRVTWRFAQAEDTLDYVVTDSAGRESLLEAEWRRRGAVVARSRSQLDALRRPARARVDFPEAPARFELTVSLVDTAAVIPPNAWRSRR
ncbi:MAG: hypothetical protein AUH41_10645 [Gemmatimonadetes bacterium 13_1_40CM_66_11]|nr:MAG: hypothetical protein AUH41_10645 [Gemmatimonadetes bacterium 13_1_40CM_66_11]